MGDYAKAEPLYQRALKIWEKTVGPEHPNTALSLNDLALSYDKKMGDYAQAEPLNQRALKIDEKSLGPEHPYTATSLNALALLYADIGEPEEAFAWPRRLDGLKKEICRTFCPLPQSSSAWHFRRQREPYTLPATLGSAPELAEIFFGEKGWCSTRCSRSSGGGSQWRSEAA